MTYTNPHRWLPGFGPADGDAALRTLVTRYLYAYGLTTPQRRQLHDEAGLVAAVMETTATLTVGTVTVGPHA